MSLLLLELKTNLVDYVRVVVMATHVFHDVETTCELL
jgi:hypothetical protein